MKNTRITYLYRDPCNYKCWGEEVIKGILTKEELVPSLIEGEFFIPQDVGLPKLQPELLTEEDHDLHTIENLEETADRPTLELSSGELLKAFRAAKAKEWSLF